MIYSPKAIANFFIELAASKGDSITPMKLQKLIYYACGWYAGYTGQSLINEPIEAWQYGPVIPSVYHQFKQYGSGAIQAKATEFNSADFSFCEVPAPGEESIRQFLSNIWNSYGSYTGIKLSEMTHADGSPWALTWQNSQGMMGVDIPLELIGNHFKSAIEQSHRQAGA